MDNSEFFEDLIVRYLAGEATPDDEKVLFALLKDSEENARHFLVMKNIWEQAGNPLENTDSVLADDFRKVESRIKRETLQQRFATFGAYFRNTAAILILPLIAASVFLFTYAGSQKAKFVPVSHEIYTMPGTRVHTLLPDSTEVWINGGSTLLYSRANPDDSRNIHIEGEAYFKVAHDTEHPFVVNTGKITVEAVGTEFNVCSYASDTLTTVTLTDGSVLVTDSLSKALLTPGQVIVYNDNIKRSRLYLGNTDKNVQWRTGNLVFKNEPLCNVYKRLGQIYGIKFDVDAKLHDVLFYATFENASLEQVMQLIQKSTSLEYASSYSNEDGTVKHTIHVKAKS
ncbi:MAG: DUF4974 domain-containing protein [Bacteroidales bacterium]|nr:DUF4974 domain-containing protein [Bacteroidales bacterium]